MSRASVKRWPGTAATAGTGCEPISAERSGEREQEVLARAAPSRCKSRVDSSAAHATREERRTEGRAARCGVRAARRGWRRLAAQVGVGGVVLLVCEEATQGERGLGRL